MAPPEPQLTQKEIRELFVTSRQNQAAMSTLNKKIDDIHRIVAGNGDYKSSLVGRLQLVEERQMVGANKQDEICDDLNQLQRCSDKHTVLLEKDHTRIADLVDGQRKGDKERAELKDIVEAARNKAIGIGIGVGLGTGAGLFGLSQLIAKLSETVVP